MSSLVQVLTRLITNPKIRFGYLSKLGLYNNWPDDKYLKKEYFLNIGKELDLENPKSFNEKIQWLKLYDRKSIYTTMVDKYEVKEYIANLIGQEYIVPLLGVWGTPDEINFESLPQQFVLKTTHDSGGVVVCRNRENMNTDEIKKKLWKSLRTNYYLVHREWPYKNVERKIIAEMYMHDNNTNDIRDYKIHCFNGEPKYIQVIGNRNHALHTGNQMFYTFDWENAGWSFDDYPPYPYELDPPYNLQLMYKIAKKISRDHKYIRVDLYEINGKVYFGEVTFYPGGGFYPYGEVFNYNVDLMLGKKIQL